MKILLFAPYYPPVIGGQEYHERELAKVLQKNGVEVELLTRYKKPGPLLARLSTFLFYFTSFFKLFFKKYDLIYGYDVHAGTVMLLFRFFSRRPTVLIIFVVSYRRTLYSVKADHIGRPLMNQYAGGVVV